MAARYCSTETLVAKTEVKPLDPRSSPQKKRKGKQAQFQWAELAPGRDGKDSAGGIHTSGRLVTAVAKGSFSGNWPQVPSHEEDLAYKMTGGKQVVQWQQLHILGAF